MELILALLLILGALGWTFIVFYIALGIMEDWRK
jgi:hypothetical protein